MSKELMSAEFYNNLSFFKLFMEYEPNFWYILIILLLIFSLSAVHLKPFKAVVFLFTFILFIFSLIFYDSASKSLLYFNSYNYCKSEKLTTEAAELYISRCMNSFRDYETSNSSVYTPHLAMYNLARNRLQSEKLNAEPYDVSFIEGLRKIPEIELYNLSSNYYDSHSYAMNIHTEIQSNIKDIEYLGRRLESISNNLKQYSSIEAYASEHQFELKEISKLYNVEKSNLVKNKELFNRATAHCKRTESFSACIYVESAYNEYKRNYENLSKSNILKKIVKLSADL